MQIHLGDALEVLKNMPSDSVDSLVTDPPAGIGFMGKEWDHHKGGRAEWVAWLSEVMKEAMRVMKPGAHGLVWAIPRTSHWTAMALEDAGFEVRDCVTHLFGSGFPKSMGISKAIDKAAGATRQVVGVYESPEGTSGRSDGSGSGFGIGGLNPITAPATEDAKKWEGWGTALKPAAEFWWLVRKPCSEKTIAANVLKHGTGALNIGVSRIEHLSDADLATSLAKNPGRSDAVTSGTYGTDRPQQVVNTAGRFPANLVLSHSEHCTDLACCMFTCPVAELDRQSEGTRAAKPSKSGRCQKDRSPFFNANHGGLIPATSYADSGGASRFFYCAKISSSERNAAGSNGHPTVKAKKLMAYLIRLITPPGGTVLDPFAGSGSTGVAAKEAGFGFIGIEKEAEYHAIASARIAHAIASRG